MSESRVSHLVPLFMRARTFPFYLSWAQENLIKAEGMGREEAIARMAVIWYQRTTSNKFYGAPGSVIRPDAGTPELQKEYRRNKVVPIHKDRVLRIRPSTVQKYKELLFPTKAAEAMPQL